MFLMCFGGYTPWVSMTLKQKLGQFKGESKIAPQAVTGLSRFTC